MWSLPRRLVEAMADVTLGTAIVLIHMTLAQRERPQQPPRTRTRAS
jgi:hypothetical protein